MFKNDGSIDIPIWNGVVKKKTRTMIKKFRLVSGSTQGIYEQYSKISINYSNNYRHMTPLSGSRYIEKLHFKKKQLFEKIKSKYDDILEVGSGNPSLINLLNFKSFYLIDPCFDLKKLPKLKNVVFLKKKFENFSSNKKFDLIILFSVLEHVKNLDKFSKNLKQISNEKSKFLIVLPIVDRQFYKGDINSILHEHTYYFTLNGFKNYCKKYDFKILFHKIENDCGYFILKNCEFKSKQFLKSNFSIQSIIKNMNTNILKNFYYMNKYENISFIGANNGLNILLYLYSNLFGKNKIKNFDIYDNDFYKKDSYIPASPKKIKFSKKLPSNKNFIITAGSFYEEIKKTIKKQQLIDE